MHQHFNGQLPMEAVPHAGHIVAQAGLTFAVPVARSTPGRRCANSAKRQWRRGRQIAPIELGLALLPRQRALADEPALWAGLIGMSAPYAQGAELLGQRSRTAPAPSDGVPSGLRLTRQHRSGALQGATCTGCGCVRGRPACFLTGNGRAAAAATSASRRRQSHWRRPPHSPPVAGPTHRESGGVAVTGIGAHPGKRDPAARA